MPSIDDVRVHASGDALVPLEPVDRAEVTIVMDNFVDILLAGSEDVHRYVIGDFSDRKQLVAEHGFSALVTVESDGRRSSVLYDAGLTPDGLACNLDVLDVPVKDLRAIVISHGHADHHGGLEGFFARYGRCRLPLVIHPEAWAERKVVSRPGPSCACRRRAGATSKPRVFSWWRSAARPCSWTTPCSCQARSSA